MKLSVAWRDEAGTRLPMACWHPGPGYRMISSGVLGGGIGPREWVLNAQVRARYARTDPAAHVLELAGGLGLTGPGVGMLTAARVTDLVSRRDHGAEAAATAGLRVPAWAAAPAGAQDPDLAPGTINVIVSVPVPLTDGALVNAVITATEAKTQAVLEAGFPGTGTATDAVCVAAPVAAGGAAETFAGPRSVWGARIARVVHAAVLAGAARYAASLLPAAQAGYRRPRTGVTTVLPSAAARTATCERGRSWRVTSSLVGGREGGTARAAAAGRHVPGRITLPTRVDSVQRGRRRPGLGPGGPSQLRDSPGGAQRRGTAAQCGSLARVVTAEVSPVCAPLTDVQAGR